MPVGAGKWEEEEGRGNKKEKPCSLTPQTHFVAAYLIRSFICLQNKAIPGTLEANRLEIELNDFFNALQGLKSLPLKLVKQILKMLMAFG